MYWVILLKILMSYAKYITVKIWVLFLMNYYILHVDNLGCDDDTRANVSQFVEINLKPIIKNIIINISNVGEISDDYFSEEFYNTFKDEIFQDIHCMHLSLT